MYLIHYTTTTFFANICTELIVLQLHSNKQLIEPNYTILQLTFYQNWSQIRKT